jgi:hypothetical protein
MCRAPSVIHNSNSAATTFAGVCRSLRIDGAVQGCSRASRSKKRCPTQERDSDTRRQNQDVLVFIRHEGFHHFISVGIRRTDSYPPLHGRQGRARRFAVSAAGHILDRRVALGGWLRGPNAEFWPSRSLREGTAVIVRSCETCVHPATEPRCGRRPLRASTPRSAKTHSPSRPKS